MAALFSIFDRFLWNFQQILDLCFSETSQNFSLFRQLFFIVSKGGPKEKNSKTKKSKKSAAKWAHRPFCAFTLLKFCTPVSETPQPNWSILTYLFFFRIRSHCTKNRHSKNSYNFLRHTRYSLDCLVLVKHRRCNGKCLSIYLLENLLLRLHEKN